MDTFLITGASRGIGLELSKQCLRAGHNVVSTYRKSKPDSFSNLEGSENFSSIDLEVTSSESIKALVSKLGKSCIDVLVNNAGILGPESQSLQDIDENLWLEVFAVNSISPLSVSRALLPNLLRSANPRIIGISSQMGSLSRNSTGMYAYRSSKAALNKIMQVLALEQKDNGITVCPIHPGWVRTDMGGDNADISVEESAAGILTIIENIQLKDSGKFFTWSGEEHAW